MKPDILSGNVYFGKLQKLLHYSGCTYRRGKFV